MTGPTADRPTTSSPGLAPPGAAARAHYFATASNWSQDTVSALRASRRTAWIIASCACGLAVAQGIAIVAMLPLKQAVPYTITVDRETGYVQTARGVNIGNLSETEAVAQAFVAQYVLARETFDATDYRENFRKTAMWSQGAAEIEYTRDWDRANPNSVHTRYRPTTKVRVTVKSVTILGPRSALIRFDTEQSENGGAAMRQPYAATVAYTFSGKPISERDRYLNPLGFQVSSYRRDAETPGSYPLPAPPPPPAPIAQQAAPPAGLPPVSPPVAAPAATPPGGAPPVTVEPVSP